MIQISEPYIKRSIRFLGLWEKFGWSVKLYGIVAAGDEPQYALIDAAVSLLPGILPQTSSKIYHVGFLGIHEGKESNIVFFDWWQNENELCHRVFSSAVDISSALMELGTDDFSVCVWDVYLQYFERNAWVRHILSKYPYPDVEGYLNERCNEVV
jgi:hypothetical protein